MRASWTTPRELLTARVGMSVCILAVPASVIWLAIVDRAEPPAIAMLTVGGLLVGFIPMYAPAVHAIDVEPDRVVLHALLAPTRSVPRSSVDGVLLVPGMETFGRYGEAHVVQRIVVVGADGRALGRGSWTRLAPDVDALRGVGLRVLVDADTRRPGAVEARVPGSTTRLERLSYGGIWRLGIVLALAIMVVAAVLILVLD